MKSILLEKFWKVTLKFYHFKIIFFLFFCSTLYAASFRFDKLDYVKVLEKEERSLIITKYVKIKPYERIFNKQYWKVYYLKNKIVGEELFINSKLVYYYVYYHAAQKIYQKGFLWHGIYQHPKYKKFKAHDKTIKQGKFYKNYPETYRVYNKNGKLIYPYNYQDFEN